jgi:hypothetical protein
LTTDNPVKLVIANKSDLENKSVNQDDIRSFTKKTGIEVIETSAKMSLQVSSAFEILTKKLIEKA